MGSEDVSQPFHDDVAGPFGRKTTQAKHTGRKTSVYHSLDPVGLDPVNRKIWSHNCWIYMNVLHKC